MTPNTASSLPGINDDDRMIRSSGVMEMLRCSPRDIRDNADSGSPWVPVVMSTRLPGAKSVTAVEANARAYLKCLIAKEIFGMPNAAFILGDCLEYLRTTDLTFDVGIACGILYHLTNPVELLELLARRCDSIFLWTVFYDAEFVAKNPVPGAKFSDVLEMKTAGYKHIVHRFNYGPSLDWKGFCGGGEVFSYWMEKEQIIGALRHFGFTDFRTEQHPNVHGSALMLAARKA